MYHSLEQRRQLAEIERALLQRVRRDRIEAWSRYERPDRLAEAATNASPATTRPPSAPMPA